MDLLAELQGGEELKRELRKLEPAFLAAMEDTLPGEGEQLKSQANAMAPSQSGELKASALVSKDRRQHRVRVAVAYTDKKAAAVHEGVHWNRHFETRGFKWFERAFHAFEEGFARRIVEKLQSVVGRFAK